MPQGTFFEEKRASPTSLTLVLALHAAAIAALLLAKGPIYEPVTREPTKVVFIPDSVPPEEIPQPQPDPQPAQPHQQTRIDTVPPIVPTLPSDGPVVDFPRLPPVAFDPAPSGTSDIPGPRPEPRPVPPPDPVRVEAQIDPRHASALQPPYPASEERAGNEGTVRIRIIIGADGRIKAAERVSATSDAFWRATERQALSRWRFRPATVDGRPVESRKVMTVHFQLRDR